jgi:PAS domain S-box-containing protein
MDPTAPRTEIDQAHELALLVDSVADYAIFLLDTEGNVRTWNTGANRLKGYTAEEIVGQHFSRFYTEKDLARAHPAEVLETARRTGRFEEEGWRVRKDGSHFWASVVITALYNDKGVLTGFGKVTRDLTSRRLREDQLRMNAAELAAANAGLESYQRLVSDVADYAILLLDPQGIVTTWNKGAERLKGWSAEEIVGQHFSTFYTEADRQRGHPDAELEQAIRDGRYEEEGWRVRSDATQFWANVIITPLYDDGELVGYAKVTRDLTDRRAQEEALRRTNTELEHFATAAAHDLQEPMRTISALAGLLETRYSDGLPPQGREAVAHISSGIARLQDLVDALLAYAGASQRSITAEPVDLGALVARVTEALGAAVAERHAAVQRNIGPETVVSGDAKLIELVLQNLVSNAVKFADPEAPVIGVAARRENGHVRVEITDNGGGIDPADQARIFEPFQRVGTSRAGGTGVGLATCQRIVARHGGAIGVESALGEGSRFWFTLPAAGTPAQ